MMKRIWLFILAGLLLLTGFGILLYPNINRIAAGVTDREKIVHFREEQKIADGEDTPYADLLAQMQDYNKKIYENGQEDLKDVWSYEQNPFDFDTAGLPDDMIGYITIDAMDEEMPLYIGANKENMSKGAVVMGQTSMPVGGENTNCVIAAHRGYRGIPMFQYIEVLQPGDKVEITNLWETIEYEVVKCIVIRPDDIDAVKIIPGQDMLTLITCHPYTQNYQRYVVYCRRSDREAAAIQEGDQSDPLTAFDGVVYESSAGDIRREQLINTAVLTGLAVVCLAVVMAVCVKGRKQRKRKKHVKRERGKRRSNG